VEGLFSDAKRRGLEYLNVSALGRRVAVERYIKEEG